MKPEQTVMAVLGMVLVNTTGRAETNAVGGDLILFHAGSLSVPLREVAEQFQRKYPGVRVKAEASGSRDAARKISDLGRECDVLAAADYRVVQDLLSPAHAEFNIVFAANEMAVAYTAKSEYAGQITGDNWPEILLRNEVAVGRADPDRDPCGYRALMVMQLAENHYRLPGLAGKLGGKDVRYIRPKETDLLALLESGEIDYLFIYRSVCLQHKLPFVPLPAEVNLGSPSLADAYRQAAVRVTGAKPGEFLTQTGEPIAYSVTIPRRAPNPPAARAFVAFLLSPEGRAVMARNGQTPIVPARVDRADKLPELLRPFCRQEGRP